MSDYKLTPDAEDDLREIARYTATTWGAAQAHRYKAKLLRGFASVARESGQPKRPIPHRSDVQIRRCEHHYIFSIHEEGAKPAIVAILHENMDLPARLRERLEK